MSEKNTLRCLNCHSVFSSITHKVLRLRSYKLSRGRLVITALLLVAGFASSVAAPCTPPVVNLGQPIVQCGGTVTLDAGNSGSTYLWSNNSTSEFLQVDTSGTYSVIVTNAPNCSASGSVNVTINPVPVVNLGTNISQCGGSVTLDGGSGNAGILVDQSQPSAVTLIADFSQADIAQSFTPSLSSISGASIIFA